MFRTIAAASLLFSVASFAQTDAGVPEASDLEALRRDLDATRKELQQLRQETTAQMSSMSQNQATRSAPYSRKLETFVPDGFFRVRPELLHKMDLGRGTDPSGNYLFPRSDATREQTVAGVNMRFRFEPTLNVSEEVRIKTQVDIFDNVLFGSTPDYAFARSGPAFQWERDEFGLFSQSQLPPTSGFNSLADSIRFKRVWGEVSTPVGILRFGRMGSHWGMGMVNNDGNCLDCDLGDNVDRVMFVAEPLPNWFIVPMFDFNVEGPEAQRPAGAPVDLSNFDDAHSLVLAIARRNTDSAAQARLKEGKWVFDGGIRFEHRWQKFDAQDYLGQPFASGGVDRENFVQRFAKIFIPDLWVKLERKEFMIEFEFASIFGDIYNRALSGAAGSTPGQNQNLGILQFGAVLQAEYRLLNQDLRIGLEAGFASGDSAPGFGNYPRRVGNGPGGQPLPGDVEGRQYNCSATGDCSDARIMNFRFNRAYRTDMILFREILNGITDAIYVKPKVSYRITEGFEASASFIYSRAIFASSTPSAADPAKADANLGAEINAGVRYETQDGFFSEIRWGILFPLEGLKNNELVKQPTQLETANAVRGTIGIRF